jgi:polar amino acid transport system substrate-binding protein
MKLRIAVLVAALAVAAPAAALTVLTEENPPLNFSEGGRITGAATAVVAEMGKRAGVPLAISMSGWDEAYRRAQSGRDTCVYSTARLPPRERLFQWVGPIATNRWAVYGRPDFAGTVSKLDDLKKYRLGGVKTDAKVSYLKEMSVVNILEWGSEREIAPKLGLPKSSADYIDLWISSVGAAPRIAKAANVPDVKLVYVFREHPVYLACSPQVPKDTIAKLTQAIEAMTKDGSAAKLAEGFAGR